MWFLLGVGAILTALLNLIWWSKSKNSEKFRFASISLTALALCFEYSMIKGWVIKGDWSALMDVVPAMSSTLWVLVIASILINGVTFIKRK